MIPLASPRTRPPLPQDGPSRTDAGAPPEIDERIWRALDALRRRAGDRAAELPARVGRAALRCERLLTSGPTVIDPMAVDPLRAIDAANRILDIGTTIVDMVDEEATVLGEALACDLRGLPFERLDRVASCVLALSTAPRATAAWAHPTAAAAAQTVLLVAADDLRDGARSHAEMYDRYRDGIWQVPDSLLNAARRRWRLVAHARLRVELRAVSRTGRVPGRLGPAAKQVLAARASRDRIESLSPLLSHHLAELHRGPFSDVDAALVAIGAVRDLQAALGELLAADRLEGLLMADAFRSHDVTGAAASLHNALRAWGTDVSTGARASAGTMCLSELATWISETSRVLPSLKAGHAATVRLAATAPTLGALVDTLLLRESVQEMVDQLEQGDGTSHAWSAS
ncbi:MAG: hypothetical protein ACT452_17675 [Microthrixaceae bacterium]